MSDKLQEIKEALDKYATTRSFEYMAAKEHISINAPGWLDWLIEQLEQATADKNELMDGLKDMHEQLEQCMGSHEKLEAACHRLKEDKRKLHAVHDENYAKAAHRAGVIEELQADNQKLVECLEWYTNCGYAAYDEDCGERAAQTLSEVKGNG